MKYVSAEIWQLLIVLALSPCVHGLDVRLCYTAGFLCNIVDWLVAGGPAPAPKGLQNAYDSEHYHK